jgi:hypothetical protein
MVGLENFKCGCIRRIGDGTHVNIWEDAWIPTSPTRIITTSRGKIVATKVSDTIDPITGMWGEELIRSFFCSVVADHILEIPIALAGMDGFVAWHYTSNDMLSIDQHIM